MPTVYLSVGIPGAGKTTFWKQFCKEHDVVFASPDDIRTEMLGDYRYRTHEDNLKVWDRIFDDVKKALDEGKDVVIDGAYIERHYRKDDIALYRQWGADKVVAYWFKTPLHMALSRNRAREKPLPEEVLRNANERLTWETPKPRDGFDEIIVVNTENPK